jgi:hypothetical protein
MADLPETGVVLRMMTGTSAVAALSLLGEPSLGTPAIYGGRISSLV